MSVYQSQLTGYYMIWPEGTQCFSWDIWTGWVMSRSVCDSRRMDCGQRGPVSIFLCLFLASSSKKKKWESIPCCDEWSRLSHRSPLFLDGFFSVPLLFLFTAVKGQRTGRSRYLWGTRSVVTGWGKTFISTCTSARHRAVTGGSTRPMKSPLTVRLLTFLLPLCSGVDKTENMKIRLF